MNRITLVAALLGMVVFTGPASAQTLATANTHPAQLRVTGQGLVERPPDRVVVSFSLVTTNDVAAQATSANNAIYNALVARERALNLDAAAIKTVGYELRYNPRPRETNPGSTEVFGYTVTRSVSIASDHPEQAGAIIDNAVAAGVGTVNGVSFGLRDGDGAYRAALAAAIADCGAQAQALAAAAHVRIVRIIEIAIDQRDPNVRMIGRTAARAASIPTDVQPSNLSVSAIAVVTYQIAP